MSEEKRRLAAILAADVVGYSAMVGADEPGMLARVRALRTDVIEPLAITHEGRLFKTTGDGFFAEFASAVQALGCAIAIQDMLRAQPDGLRLRIGVHQGEVVPEGGDLMGDGVIIAALGQEPLAEPGGICISSRVREDASGKMALEVVDLGEARAEEHCGKNPRVPCAPRHGGTHRRWRCPTSRRLWCCRSRTCQAILSRSISPMAWWRISPPRYRASAALFVIARNSAFTYKGRAIDVRRVGHELGVRYVVEGSVRKSGNRVRITCQLIEAATAAHVWADRFDSELAELFDLQDRVTEQIAGAVEPNLRRAEILRALAKPTENLNRL